MIRLCCAYSRCVCGVESASSLYVCGVESVPKTQHGRVYRPSTHCVHCVGSCSLETDYRLAIYYYYHLAMFCLPNRTRCWADGAARALSRRPSPCRRRVQCKAQERSRVRRTYHHTIHPHSVQPSSNRAHVQRVCVYNKQATLACFSSSLKPECYAAYCMPHKGGGHIFTGLRGGCRVDRGRTP